jgi:membrane protein
MVVSSGERAGYPTRVDSAVDKVPGARSVVGVRVPLMGGMRLGQLVGRLKQEITEDKTTAFAGNLTYRGLFSLFPFLTFLLALLGIFHATDLVNDLVDQLAPYMPAEAEKLLRDDILGTVAAKGATGAVTTGAIISLLVALWGVSGAMRSVMEAMNVMYDAQDTRSFVRKYLVSILLALAAAVLFLSALVLVVAGPPIAEAVADAVGLGTVFKYVWLVAQWPVLLAFVLAGFLLIYRNAPDPSYRRSRSDRFGRIFPLTIGAVVAVALWVLFSILFSIYVSTFGSYNKTFGALAGVAIAMLYLYYSSFILLLGAEIDNVVDDFRRGRELPAGTVTDRERAVTAPRSLATAALAEPAAAPSVATASDGVGGGRGKRLFLGAAVALAVDAVRRRGGRRGGA